MGFKELLLQFFGKQPDRREIKQIYNDNFREMGVKIGKNVDMYDVSIDTLFPFLIEIGNNCIITGGTKILAHDASLSLFTNQYKVGRVKINDNVFIGMDTIIMPGVEVGSNTIIGANSVVTKTISPNSVVAGVPARTICTIDEYIEKYSSETFEDNIIIINNSPKLNTNQDITEFREYVRKVMENR